MTMSFRLRAAINLLLDSPTNEYPAMLLSRIQRPVFTTPHPPLTLLLGARDCKSDPRLPIPFTRAEVERLTDYGLTPSTLFTHLSQYHHLAGERLARCMAPHAHSPPLPTISGGLPKSDTPVTTQRLLIECSYCAFHIPTYTIPPSLHIPPPVDRRDDIPESEQPPRKRLYLSTLGSRYEVGESSTARPTRGRGIDYGFVSTVDAEERRDMELEMLGVDLLMGDRMTLQETVWMVEEEAYASREAWAHSIGLSQATHQELQTHRDLVLHMETFSKHTRHGCTCRVSHSDTHRPGPDSRDIRVIRDMRREMSDMQAELLALREQQRRARQPGPEARIPDHQDASGDADSHI
ncbi:hypothetical protein Tco_0801861 [Tanacetum coccineum]|uniref:Uncharacterized protein n=1 Tax=Tanacetum coccineum TaxID=301880 RepID=A0ABQ5A1F5_9ASTR